MLPKELRQSLIEHIDHVEHPRELVVDVMFAVQEHYGYLSDEGVQETAGLLDMSALEVEQLARSYLQCLAVGEPVILDDAEMDRVLEKFKTYGS